MTAGFGRDRPAPGPTARLGWRVLRGRRGVVGLAVAGAVLAFGAHRAVWVSGTVDSALLGAPGTGSGPVDVDGGGAAPGVGALALVVLAAAAAMALAGPRSGRGLGVVIALAGAGLVALAGSVWLRPDAVLAGEAERLSAVTTVTVTDVRRGAAVPLSALGGAAVLVAGLSALRTAGGWSHSPGRYERSTDAVDPGDTSTELTGSVAWDAIDRGEDPTRRGTPPTGPASGAAAAQDLPE